MTSYSLPRVGTKGVRTSDVRCPEAATVTDLPHASVQASTNAADEAREPHAQGQRSTRSPPVSPRRGQSPDDRVDLLGLPPLEVESELARHLASRGEPAYRTEQVRRWIYGTESASFDGMSDLPSAVRAELARAFRLTALEARSVSRSTDGTAKHLWVLSDGELVESVLIPERRRLTLCVSSQAGVRARLHILRDGLGGVFPATQRRRDCGAVPGRTWVGP